MGSQLGIVTLSFNQARFLPQALKSVSAAPGRTVIYTVVDPGSTDGSREILQGRADRITHLILEPDRGPADGLNKGFAACDADLLGYLNADDRFTPGALDFVVNYFESNPETDLLLGAIRIIDSNCRPTLRGRAPDQINIPRFVSGSCFAWQQATFFRRSLFERTKGFNPENKSCWDAELVLDMVLAGAKTSGKTGTKIGYTNVILGDFRIHGQSLTGSGSQAQMQKCELPRFKEKARAVGYRLLSPDEEKWQRFKYKFDPLRHLRCLTGIKLPPRSETWTGSLFTNSRKPPATLEE